MLSGRLDHSYTSAVRRAINPITAAKVGANSAYRFAPPFLATIASGLHTSLPTMAAALAVGELAGLSAPLLGRVAARVTHRFAICGGLLGIAVTTTGCALSRNVAQLGVWLALLTMTKIVFDVGVVAWISDRVPYMQRGRVIGLTETAWAGGLFIGVVAMGLVTGLTSWRWGYALAVVAVTALAVLVRQRLPDEAKPARVERAADHVKPRLGHGWWVIIATVTLTAAAQAVFVTFGKWLKDDFGFSDIDLAMVIFALGGVELLAASTMIRYSDRWGKQRSAMVGAAMIVPCAAGLAVFSHHVVIALPILALYIGAFEFAIISALPLASNLVPGNPSHGLGLMIGAGTLGRAMIAAPAAAAFVNHGMWLPATIGGTCAGTTVLSHWRYRVSPGSHL